MKKVSLARRPSYGLTAFILFIASLVPALTGHKASAYAQLQQRTIKMSTSAQGATDATYNVSFQVATAASVGGVIVNFCQNSPIIGDTCTAPTGFKLHAKTADNTLALANQSGITDFTKDLTGAADNILVLSRSGGAAAVAANTTVSVDLGTAAVGDGVDNPNNSNTTFYARILTYDTAAHAEGYSPTAAGGGTGVIDAGGVALSTADQITIQAKVQERLTFCVYTGAAVTTNCTVSTTNPVILGDSNGVLSSTQASISDEAKYNITTNASNGATIRAKGGTLTSGGFTINPVGATSTAYATNTEQFGMCSYKDTGSTDNTTLTLATPYDDAACNTVTQGQGATNQGTAKFAFDTSTGGENMTTTYGDTIATKQAGDFSTGHLVFLGSVSNTTEPGIYTTTMTFIATGNY